jgi:hypothetical protein|tara:strand:- start:8312 stop:8611 length:300 start_codon:yes stop_codon:yes gene_type:complete
VKPAHALCHDALKEVIPAVAVLGVDEERRASADLRQDPQRSIDVAAQFRPVTPWERLSTQLESRNHLIVDVDRQGVFGFRSGPAAGRVVHHPSRIDIMR